MCTCWCALGLGDIPWSFAKRPRPSSSRRSFRSRACSWSGWSFPCPAAKTSRWWFRWPGPLSGLRCWPHSPCSSVWPAKTSCASTCRASSEERAGWGVALCALPQPAFNVLGNKSVFLSTRQKHCQEFGLAYFAGFAIIPPHTHGVSIVFWLRDLYSGLFTGSVMPILII